MTFEKWWEKKVGNSDQWTTLERLAAKDAWEAAQPQWQPIETAPINISVICSTTNGRVGEACFITGITNPSWYWADEAFPADGDGRPTHWMPLPEAPKE